MVSRHGEHRTWLTYIPAWRFHLSDDEIWKSLLNYLEADIPGTLHRREQTYKNLSSCEEIHITGKHFNITCHLGKNERTVYSTTAGVCLGENFSLSEFFEASLIDVGVDHPPFFTINGQYWFDGVLRSCVNNELTELEKDLQSFRHSSKGHKQQYIKVKNSRLEGVYSKTHQRMEQFDPYFITYNRNYEGMVREFGLGCDVQALEQLDFQKSLLSNESVYGLHLGFGLDTDCPHIDFISSASEDFLIEYR